MMTFRTVFPQERAACSITHEKRLLLLGSCFTEHIGNRLAACKFGVHVNPFGIVYNPASMAGCLARLCAGGPAFKLTELFENQGLWHSWEHHGDFSRPDREQALAGINRAFYTSMEALRQTDVLLLTLGAAELFFLQNTGRVVANNHKMPAALFDRRRMSVQEILDQIFSALHQIRTLRPNIEVILTVSPVRHLRSGMVENQRSKSALLLACAELCEQMPGVYYFPAYELLLDDLRDYRFYASDMVHPNEIAVDYIWQYFSACYFPETTKQLNRELEKLRAAVEHRPFNPDTPEHRAFAQRQMENLARLGERHPALDFSEEREYFNRFLI